MFILAAKSAAAETDPKKVLIPAAKRDCAMMNQNSWSETQDRGETLTSCLGLDILKWEDSAGHLRHLTELW